MNLPTTIIASKLHQELYHYKPMLAPKRRRGRPPKYATEEERKAARQKTAQDSYRRLKEARHEQGPQHKELLNGTATAQELQIEIDPLSILRQTRPRENRHATASYTEMQREGSIIHDENEQQQFLQVFIYTRFLLQPFSF